MEAREVVNKKSRNLKGIQTIIVVILAVAFMSALIYLLNIYVKGYIANGYSKVETEEYIFFYPSDFVKSSSSDSEKLIYIKTGDQKEFSQISMLLGNNQDFLKLCGLSTLQMKEIEANNPSSISEEMEFISQEKFADNEYEGCITKYKTVQDGVDTFTYSKITARKHSNKAYTFIAVSTKDSGTEFEKIENAISMFQLK